MYYKHIHLLIETKIMNMVSVCCFKDISDGFNVESEMQ
jgi:hypothetical protein